MLGLFQKKKPVYFDLDSYDLSDYVELKGDILYKINGGTTMSSADQAAMAEACKSGNAEKQAEIRAKYETKDSTSTSTGSNGLVKPAPATVSTAPTQTDTPAQSTALDHGQQADMAKQDAERKTGGAGSSAGSYSGGGGSDSASGGEKSSGNGSSDVKNNFKMKSNHEDFGNLTDKGWPSSTQDSNKQNINVKENKITGKAVNQKDACDMLYQAAGFIISHAETDDEIAVAEAVKYMMDNKRVQLDDVVSRHERPGIRHSTTERGFTDYYHNTETGNSRGIIVLDINRAMENDLGELIETLSHECWHVVQHDRGRFEITDENNFKLNFHREPEKFFYDYLTDFEYEAYSMGLNMNNKYRAENGLSIYDSYEWDKIRNLYPVEQK